MEYCSPLAHGETEISGRLDHHLNNNESLILKYAMTNNREIGEVRRAFYDLLSAQDELGIHDEHVAIARQAVDAARIKYTVGKVPLATCLWTCLFPFSQESIARLREEVLGAKELQELPPSPHGSNSRVLHYSSESLHDNLSGSRMSEFATGAATAT